MRQSGILMHVSSLPSEYGIGTFGKSAYEFVDFLHQSKQKIWQVLPLGPTGYGDSPYQTFSAFAGNPYFIDYDILMKDGLLKEEDYYQYKINSETVNYEYVYNTKFIVLKKAFKNFDINNFDYLHFKEECEWLNDYALYMTIKVLENNKCFCDWDNALKLRKSSEIAKVYSSYSENIEYWKFIQYEFYKQWNELKKYANERNIKIMGDVPIYVAYDSCDVWSNPSIFLLDKNLNPTLVAGCPPDYFSDKGQLWGNPIYNYEVMERNDYSWWVSRIKNSMKLYDIVRIDHFRGFASYYTIKYGSKDAINGQWIKGPGMKLFNTLKKEIDNLNIVAEDLGYLTEEVYKLLDDSKFPGMKVMQFGFDRYNDSPYAIHNIIRKCVLYTGTHDNNTAIGWFNELSNEDKEYVCKYLNIKDGSNIANVMIAEAYKSVADTIIIPIQDYLEQNENYRYNTPSKPQGNWTYKILENYNNLNLVNYIKTLVETYKR